MSCLVFDDEHAVKTAGIGDIIDITEMVRESVEAYGQTMDTFDEVIGLDMLKLFHLNDSKMPLGSKRDRHEQIGDGEIGLEAFRLLMNDRRFEHTPGVLETPPFPSGEKSYKRNLRVLRGLIGKKESIKVKGQRRLV